jgi:CRISPR/Cas system endoribonuclease Cas6 (RAMP superfamily)
VRSIYIIKTEDHGNKCLFQYIAPSEVISDQQDKQEKTLSNHHMWQQLFRQSLVAVFLLSFNNFAGVKFCTNYFSMPALARSHL